MKIKALRMFSLYHLGTVSQGEIREVHKEIGEVLVKLHLAGPYYEQIVRLVKAPTYLGLPTTFGNKINQYSATAISEAEVCFIDIQIFRELLEKNHQFSY